VDRFESLRAWAKGSYPLEAATELLLRAFSGRFASPGQPWMGVRDGGEPWIDFEAIPSHIGGLSGGEQRFLLLVASLAGDGLVTLGDVLPGLDRDLMKLVLAAVAHAAGTHEGAEVVRDPDGSAVLRKASTLHPWPEAKPKLRLVSD
jgi:hypothetical protein